MNNLEPVTLVQRGLGPSVAGNNFSIQFDSHAIRLHPQQRNQSSNGKGRLAGCGRVLSLVAVNMQFHRDLKYASETLICHGSGLWSEVPESRQKNQGWYFHRSFKNPGFPLES